MIFECLIVKSYKGTSKTRQTEIVKGLGGGKQHEDSYIWEIIAHTPEDIKRIESTLRGKVPYTKWATSTSKAEHYDRLRASWTSR